MQWTPNSTIQEREPIWPWTAAAVVLWILLTQTDPMRPAALAALVGAAATTACTLLVRERVARSVPRAEAATRRVDDLDGLRMGAIEVPCPCGCVRFVADETGWLSAMTAWVTACHDLVREATARGTRGASLEQLVRDTAEVRDLLIGLCHGNGGIQARWTAKGVVAAWDFAWQSLEHVIAKAVGQEEFSAWKHRTMPLRRDRNGYTSLL